MNSKILMLSFGIMFVFGWFCNSAFSSIVAHASASSVPSEETSGNQISNFFGNRERISPSDWIEQNSIHMYNNKVVIEIENPQWAVFTDTNSMDPVIDEGSHAIEIIPKSPKEISEGDIISYKSEHMEGFIIHRVIDVGEDKDGWYCRTKGDNNPFEDPGKIRFSQIQRVLVAIIY